MSCFKNAICHTSEMQLKVWLVCKHLSHLGMQLKHPVYKKLCTLVYVCHSQRCSGTSGLIVMTGKVVMGARKKELGAKTEKTKRKSNVNAVKSTLRMMSMRQQQRLAKQIKRVVVLRNHHIFAFCAVQRCTHVLKLFQCKAYALPSFSHFSHFVAHA